MEQVLTNRTDPFKMLQKRQSLTQQDIDDVTKRNVRRITLQLEVRNTINNEVCITKGESDGLIVIGGKWSAVIAEERDALKVAATAGPLI